MCSNNKILKEDLIYLLSHYLYYYYLNNLYVLPELDNNLIINNLYMLNLEQYKKDIDFNNCQEFKFQNIAKKIIEEKYDL